MDFSKFSGTDIRRVTGALEYTFIYELENGQLGEWSTVAACRYDAVKAAEAADTEIMATCVEIQEY